MGVNSLNLPTWFTISRFGAALVLPIIFLVFDRPTADHLALIVFVIGALTDYADGQLARRMHLESRLGAVLDPVADKVLVIIALAVLLAYFEPHAWMLLPVVAIIMRELLVAGLRECLGPTNDNVLKVTRIAKYKAACQMIAIILILLSGVVTASSEIFMWGGIAVLWMAAILTVISGIDYVQKAILSLGPDNETD